MNCLIVRLDSFFIISSCLPETLLMMPLQFSQRSAVYHPKRVSQKTLNNKGTKEDFCLSSDQASLEILCVFAVKENCRGGRHAEEKKLFLCVLA